MTITTEYNETIREQIIGNLDGWEVILPPTPTQNDDVGSGSRDNNTTGAEDDIVEPFITDINDYTNKPNKKVRDEEVEKFYYQSFDKALSYCNRWNVDDLSQTELDLFLKGVCLLTASDLWNKYNIRVNNEDMEDTYVQSFGGLLYKQAVMILKSFINQRVTSLSSLKKKANNNNGNEWFV